MSRARTFPSTAAFPWYKKRRLPVSSFGRRQSATLRGKKAPPRSFWEGGLRKIYGYLFLKYRSRHSSMNLSAIPFGGRFFFFVLRGRRILLFLFFAARFLLGFRGRRTFGRRRGIARFGLLFLKQREHFRKTGQVVQKFQHLLGIFEFSHQGLDAFGKIRVLREIV